MTAHYRSYHDLQTDLRNWIPHLPPIKAVAGVPRSGIIPAAMLAMEMHIPLLPIESVLDGVTAYRPGTSRTLYEREGFVLLLDDTVWSGKTLQQMRPRLAHRPDVLCGAVYGNPKTLSAVDVCGYTFDTVNHVFSWNMFRDGNTNCMATDLDGVLCEDWSGPEEGEHAERYRQHVENAKPLFLPRVPPDTNWRLRAIVTSRLHGHTEATKAWLAKHRVEYGELVTAPYANCAERTRKRGFAERKAKLYGYLAAKGCRWFVESDPGQADTIARLTGLPVIDFKGQRGINCAPPVPVYRRPVT